MVYNIYPAVDNVTYQFPPIIVEKLAATPELRSTIIPMTQAQRNDLSGLNLWDGRLVFNLTTKKINRYDSGTLLWYEIDSDNKVLRAGDTMTGALTLPGAPTLDLHAATKGYVDDLVETYRPLSGRNRIINGDFSVNQRAFTSTVSSGVIGFDRWVLNYVSGTAGTTYSAQAPALGDLPESARAFARLAVSAQSAVGDNAILRQNIESVRSLSGKTVTISFWAKAASGTPKVAVEVNQMFGTGGSPSSMVNTYGGQVTLSTSWARYSVTVAVPSIAGKTLGSAGDDHLALALWTSAGSNFNARTGSLGIQNNTFDFWGVQVEEGSVVTPYEHKPYAEELRACQRYYYRIQGTSDVAYNGWALVGSGFFNAATSARVAIKLPVAMRAKPTSYMAGAFSAGYSSTGVALSALSSLYWSPLAPDVMFHDFTCATATLGAACVVYTDRTSAYIEFSAEL